MRVRSLPPWVLPLALAVTSVVGGCARARNASVVDSDVLRCLGWSQDSRTLIYARMHRSLLGGYTALRRHDIRSGENLDYRMPRDSNLIGVSPDGKRVAYSMDRDVYVDDIASHTTYGPHKVPGSAQLISMGWADSRRVILLMRSAAAYQEPYVIDADTGVDGKLPIRVPVKTRAGIDTVSGFAGGGRLIYPAEDGRLHAYSFDSGADRPLGSDSISSDNLASAMCMLVTKTGLVFVYQPSAFRRQLKPGESHDGFVKSVIDSRLCMSAQAVNLKTMRSVTIDWPHQPWGRLSPDFTRCAVEDTERHMGGDLRMVCVPESVRTQFRTILGDHPSW